MLSSHVAQRRDLPLPQAPSQQRRLTQRGDPALKWKRRPGIGRWPSLVVLTAAGTLMLTGLAQAGTTPSPSASASPSATASPHPSASPSPAPSAPVSGSSLKPQTGGKPGTTCSVTTSGRLTDCQRPVAKSKLPSAARNTGTVAQPVSNLASLVDTRTWTTGGGKTFPGAEVPYGLAPWSPDTTPRPQP